MAYTIYRSSDIDCRNIIQDAFEHLEALIQAGDVAQIQETLNLCHPFDTENAQEIGYLFQRLIDYIIEYIERRQ